MPFVVSLSNYYWGGHGPTPASSLRSSATARGINARATPSARESSGRCARARMIASARTAPILNYASNSAREAWFRFTRRDAPGSSTAGTGRVPAS